MVAEAAAAAKVKTVASTPESQSDLEDGSEYSEGDARVTNDHTCDGEAATRLAVGLQLVECNVTGDDTGDGTESGQCGRDRNDCQGVE